MAAKRVAVVVAWLVAGADLEESVDVEVAGIGDGRSRVAATASTYRYRLGPQLDWLPSACTTGLAANQAPCHWEPAHTRKPS